MYRRTLVFQATLAALSLSAASPTSAQEVAEDAERAHSARAGASVARQSVRNAQLQTELWKLESSDGELPLVPARRLARAEQAFEDGEYPMLRPLLQPILMPESQFARADLETKARALLGVGLYFEAQQVTDAAQREALLDAASLQFLELLRRDPFFTLNPLIYPASVVELFANVRSEHAEELEALRAARTKGTPTGDQEGLQTVYISREVDQLNFALNFLPFGFGQFQNDEPIKGGFFAGAQGLALGANMAGYWMVESLRSPVDGKFEGGAGNSAEVARAWQTVQYAGLGAFAAIYIWSVIDALVHYEPYRVRIRTLEGPPPELSNGANEARSTSWGLNWSGLELHW